MNKRQRKKQQTRRDKQLLAFTWDCASPWQTRFAYFDHPRRRWLSSAEWKQRRVQLKGDIEAERVAIREKLKTHNYTLAGWVSKAEVSHLERMR